MRIQLINDSKIKINFNLNDLEENNISLHSFLSGSEISKIFLKALLEIAQEDFGIIFENENFYYETFCLNFSEFIIIVTQLDKIPCQKSNLRKQKNYLYNFNNSTPFSFKFIDNKLFNYTNNMYYIFNNFEHFLDFSNYSKIFLKLFKIDSILYKYKNIFLLEIKTNQLSISDLEKIISILSETKSTLLFSELFITHIKEFSEIFISTNALNI